jgi:hypothetical protein
MFRVTIREAILMTTVVAVVLMWWLERSQNVKYEARLTALETRMQAFPFAPTLQAPGSRAVPVSFTVFPASPTMPTTAPPSAGGPVPIIPGDPPGTR